MLKASSLACVATSVAAALISGMPAQAAPCVNAPVAAYTAPGFSCSVGSLTFSDLTINVTTGGGGSVVLGNLFPLVFDNEFGLQMNYTAIAPVAGASADIAWTYNVTSTVPLTDALLQLVGNTTGSGQAQVNEVLSNGVSLSLNAPGTTSAIFSPITALHVLKDQVDFVGPAGGTSTTSIMVNGFSVVPLPGALPLFATALGGLGLLAWRRKNKVAP